MSAGYYHECDQCRKLEAAGCWEPGMPSAVPAGWFTVRRQFDPTEKRLIVLTDNIVDVCSFVCLVAYGQEHGWNDAVKVEGK